MPVLGRDFDDSVIKIFILSNIFTTLDQITEMSFYASQTFLSLLHFARFLVSASHWAEAKRQREMKISKKENLWGNVITATKHNKARRDGNSESKLVSCRFRLLCLNTTRANDSHYVIKSMAFSPQLLS